MTITGINWEQAGGVVLAVGALGTAAYGVVEAFGKALAIKTWGLPFVGLNHVRAMTKDFAAALKTTYGDDYDLIIAQQYRDGRSAGRAPDTVRQGVRLALPMMPVAEGAQIIQAAWGLDEAHATALATALQSEAVVGKAAATKAGDDAQAAILASRFAMALDSRVAAAFTRAEERYQALARFLAGVAAVVLSLLFNLGMRGSIPGDPTKGYPWLVALIIGAAAVPLAPVAKDLAAALTGALQAWKQVGQNTRA